MRVGQEDSLAACGRPGRRYGPPTPVGVAEVGCAPGGGVADHEVAGDLVRGTQGRRLSRRGVLPTTAVPRRSGTVEDIAALKNRSDLNVLFLLVDTLRANRLSSYGLLASHVGVHPLVVTATGFDILWGGGTHTLRRAITSHVVQR